MNADVLTLEDLDAVQRDIDKLSPLLPMTIAEWAKTTLPPWMDKLFIERLQATRGQACRIMMDDDAIAEYRQAFP